MLAASGVTVGTTGCAVLASWIIRWNERRRAEAKIGRQHDPQRRKWTSHEGEA
ncbi:uncharacterized protein THITE_2122865 [Thermothielavioides terrestris NRRL 8126]|uniref:Uncharacterized protein n=1 Tax=Thermothielavioides terrestris (strain ATCC 38088 / NRRL 8126) TaxID=578455 RepID=G2REI2_THETT|nr:uncharacterized protein THITE_2122865 [Thermothielavioides terrestris NRRL 8126]AEO70957.1 hypothetical protein THITE_2122865 [Thermothielavioides terrestris NRRL 8126]